MEKHMIERAIQAYTKREKTIAQIALELQVGYETVRKVLVDHGFSNGCKR